MTAKNFLTLSDSSISACAVEGRSRNMQTAIAREAWWYYLNRRQGLSLRQIARLSGRNHSTVRSGIKTASQLLDTAHPLIEPYRKTLCEAG
jgi:chromosomal replication initiation ATPase DnaA